jgi:hypothetical protein
MFLILHLLEIEFLRIEYPQESQFVRRREANSFGFPGHFQFPPAVLLYFSDRIPG